MSWRIRGSCWLGSDAFSERAQGGMRVHDCVLQCGLSLGENPSPSPGHDSEKESLHKNQDS